MVFLNIKAIMNGKVKVDEKGNISLLSGVIMGNDNFRGTGVLPSGETSLKIEMEWDEIPKTIVLTPNYNTNIWVTEKGKSGFVINVGTPPLEEASIDWVAIW